MELSKAGSWPQQTKSYIDEVKAEMRRVSWPNWNQVRATTGVVIAAIFCSRPTSLSSTLSSTPS